jgi:hypothetical protein
MMRVRGVSPIIAIEEMRWTLIESVRYVPRKPMAIVGRTAPVEADEQNARFFFGYICVCGERVVVYRLHTRSTNVLPMKKTVTCSKAHVATFAAQHFALLEDWCEDGASRR